MTPALCPTCLWLLVIRPPLQPVPVPRNHRRSEPGSDPPHLLLSRPRPRPAELERDVVSMREVKDEAAAVAQGQQRIERMLASAMSEFIMWPHLLGCHPTSDPAFASALVAATSRLDVAGCWLLFPSPQAPTQQRLRACHSQPACRLLTQRPAWPWLPTPSNLQAQWRWWMCVPVPGPCSTPTIRLRGRRVAATWAASQTLAASGACSSRRRVA